MTRMFLAAALALSSTAALAQAPAAPPAAPPLGGPLVAGVCLLSQQAVLANAKAGVAASQRLQQLMNEAQAEVNADRAPIDADAKALQAKAAKMKPADLQKDQLALQARLQVVEQKTQLRNREIELTRQKALTRVATEAQPVIAAAYKEHNCGLLIDRNNVLGGNMAGDLTAEVVAGLDKRITAFTFNRETIAPGK